jgi:transcriptional regulator with XRE-family HTH domain
MAHHAPEPPYGAALRRLRQDRNLTIEEAARRAGVTANYLGDLERGQRNPTIRVVGRVLTGIRASWKEFADVLERLPS